MRWKFQSWVCKELFWGQACVLILTRVGISCHLLELYNVAWGVCLGFHRGSFAAHTLETLDYEIVFPHPRNGFGGISSQTPWVKTQKLTHVVHFSTGQNCYHSSGAFTTMFSFDSPHSSRHDWRLIDADAVTKRGQVICAQLHSKGRAGKQPQSSGLYFPTFPRPCYYAFGGNGPRRFWVPVLSVWL